MPPNLKKFSNIFDWQFSLEKGFKLFHCEYLQLAFTRLKFLKIDQCGTARVLQTRTSAQQIALYRREVVTLFRSFARFAYTLRTTDYSVVSLWRTLRQINVPICSTVRVFFAIFLLRYFWTCAGNFKAWLDGCFCRTVGNSLNMEGGRGQALKVSSDAFVISSNMWTFYFPELENLIFGDWNFLRKMS